MKLLLHDYFVAPGRESNQSELLMQHSFCFTQQVPLASAFTRGSQLTSGHIDPDSTHLERWIQIWIEKYANGSELKSSCERGYTHHSHIQLFAGSLQQKSCAHTLTVILNGELHVLLRSLLTWYHPSTYQVVDCRAVREGQLVEGGRQGTVEVVLGRQEWPVVWDRPIAGWDRLAAVWGKPLPSWCPRWNLQK